MKQFGRKRSLALSDLKAFITIIGFYDIAGNLKMVLLEEARIGWQVVVSKNANQGHPFSEIVTIENSSEGGRMHVFSGRK